MDLDWFIDAGISVENKNSAADFYQLEMLLQKSFKYKGISSVLIAQVFLQCNPHTKLNNIWIGKRVAPYLVKFGADPARDTYICIGSPTSLVDTFSVQSRGYKLKDSS